MDEAGRSARPAHENMGLGERSRITSAKEERRRKGFAKADATVILIECPNVKLMTGARKLAKSC